MALVGRRGFVRGTGTTVAAAAVASTGGCSAAAQAFEARTERYRVRVKPLVLGLGPPVGHRLPPRRRPPGHRAGRAARRLELLFQSRPTANSTIHYGSRIVFRSGNLFLSVGDRGDRDRA